MSGSTFQGVYRLLKDHKQDSSGQANSNLYPLLLGLESVIHRKIRQSLEQLLNQWMDLYDSQTKGEVLGVRKSSLVSIRLIIINHLIWL